MTKNLKSNLFLPHFVMEDIGTDYSSNSVKKTHIILTHLAAQQWLNTKINLKI